MPDTNERQKKRIKDLRVAMQKCFPKPVSLPKLETWAFVNLGLSKQTFEKYVAAVCDVEGWVLDTEKMEVRPE